MTYMIKELEWERDGEDENYYYARPSGGLSRMYEVYLHFQSEVDSVWQMYYDNNREGLYHTLEAAKQAATEHWESRLEEALEEKVERYGGLSVCCLCESAMSPEEANRWKSTRAIAGHALSILVLDLGYKEAPIHGHHPIRHQLMWKHVVDVLGEEEVAEEARLMEVPI